MNRFTKSLRSLLPKGTVNTEPLFFDLGSNSSKIIRGKKLFIHQTQYFRDQNQRIFKLNEPKSKLSHRVELIRPIKNAQIQNVEDLSELINLFVKTLFNKDKSLLFRPQSYCLLKSNLSQVQKTAYLEAFEKSGLKDTKIISEETAVRSYLNKMGIKKCLVLDIGAQISQTYFFVESFTSPVRSTNSASANIDKAIMQITREKYQVEIGQEIAEKFKKEFIDLSWQEELEMTARAKRLKDALPDTVGLKVKDYQKSIDRFLAEIIELIELSFISLEAKYLDQISETGVVLIGGGSKIKGLTTYLESHFEIPVTLVPDAELVPVKGLAYSIN